MAVVILFLSSVLSIFASIICIVVVSVLPALLGHTKECAQYDRCAQPLSAGGRQRATCVHRRMKGTQHTRSTSHAGKQSTVRSASTAAYVYSAGGRLRTVAQNGNGCSNGLRALIALRALCALFSTTGAF